MTKNPRSGRRNNPGQRFGVPRQAFAVLGWRKGTPCSPPPNERLHATSSLALDPLPLTTGARA